MKDYKFEIQKNQLVASNVYQLVLQFDQELPPIKAGQFLMIKLLQKAHILRRPFCIAHSTSHTITVYYAVVGQGTDFLSTYSVGTKSLAHLPLGNGFDIREDQKKILLVGGGLGVAGLSKVLEVFYDREIFCYLGFRSQSHIYLQDYFLTKSVTTICTDDNSYGQQGTVIQNLKKDIAKINPDIVLCCGSVGMLKALKELVADYDMPVLVSGEPRMACGIGACLVCTCAIKQKDGSIQNKRGCVDGPVFELREMVI